MTSDNIDNLMHESRRFPPSEEFASDAVADAAHGQIGGGTVKDIVVVGVFCENPPLVLAGP
jgi:hypothetical protein